LAGPPARWVEIWGARPTPHGAPSPFLLLFFFEFSKLISNAFLNSLKAFSRVAPKTKVVQNNILYNFALRCKPRI